MQRPYTTKWDRAIHNEEESDGLEKETNGRKHTKGAYRSSSAQSSGRKNRVDERSHERTLRPEHFYSQPSPSPGCASPSKL